MANIDPPYAAVGWDKQLLYLPYITALCRKKPILLVVVVRRKDFPILVEFECRVMLGRVIPAWMFCLSKNGVSHLTGL